VDPLAIQLTRRVFAGELSRWVAHQCFLLACTAQYYRLRSVKSKRTNQFPISINCLDLSPVLVFYRPAHPIAFASLTSPSLFLQRVHWYVYSFCSTMSICFLVTLIIGNDEGGETYKEKSAKLRPLPWCDDQNPRKVHRLEDD